MAVSQHCRCLFHLLLASFWIAGATSVLQHQAPVNQSIPNGHVFMCNDIANTSIPQSKVCNFMRDCPAPYLDEANCGDCDFQIGMCQWIDDSPGTQQWSWGSGQSHTNGSAPMFDHNGSPSDHFIYMDKAFGTHGTTADLFSLQIGPSGATCQMQFYYYMISTPFVSTTMPRVQVSIEEGGENTIIWSVRGNQSPQWLRATVDINQISRPFRVHIQGMRTGRSGMLAVDDVQFINCNSPTTGSAVETSSAMWTSASTVPDNITIPACPGQNITIPWHYAILDLAEHAIDTEWRFAPDENSESTIATRVMGTFFVAPNAAVDMQYIPNAGLQLLGVDSGDTGIYSVHVNLNAHGSIYTNVQRAEVVVSTDVITEDGDLHVQMEPGSVFLSSTNQSHVLLSCGHFKSVWSRRVNVLWTDASSSQSVHSTFYKDGLFYLALSNPLSTATYTCSLDPQSPAAECVQSGSRVLTGVTVYVNVKDATINLLEGQLKMLQSHLDQCESSG